MDLSLLRARAVTGEKPLALVKGCRNVMCRSCLLFVTTGAGLPEVFLPSCPAVLCSPVAQVFPLAPETGGVILLSHRKTPS